MNVINHAYRSFNSKIILITFRTNLSKYHHCSFTKINSVISNSYRHNITRFKCDNFNNFKSITRNFSTSNCCHSRQKLSHNKTETVLYLGSLVILVIGASYGAVPLYRMFCGATGYGGTTQHAVDKKKDMDIIDDRLIKVSFNADKYASLQWNFHPQQRDVYVHPGETVLAFYSAKNTTDKPIIGISTYNVVPFAAGQYFTKIQCFCFEEQMLNPHEQVDMPVFFYIDPEFDDDPAMENFDEIILSYTFFEVDPNKTPRLSLPGFMTRKASSTSTTTSAPTSPSTA